MNLSKRNLGQVGIGLLGLPALGWGVMGVLLRLVAFRVTFGQSVLIGTVPKARSPRRRRFCSPPRQATTADLHVGGPLSLPNGYSEGCTVETQMLIFRFGGISVRGHGIAERPRCRGDLAREAQEEFGVLHLLEVVLG